MPLHSSKNIFRRIILLLALAAAAPVLAAESSPAIGLVKTATDAAIVRSGRRIPAAPGAAIVRGDLLSTGRQGALGVVLQDDTVMSLGPSTETGVERFLLQGQQSGMLVRISRGVLAYLSGKIAKLAPGKALIQTPTATLAVRGTYLVIRVEP